MSGIRQIPKCHNSTRIAQQSYLLFTEDDFANAAVVAKVMVEGLNARWCGSTEMGVWKPEDSRTEWGHLG